MVALDWVDLTNVTWNIHRFSFKLTQWPYQSKIAGSGPDISTLSVYRIVSHRYKAVVHSLLHPMYATIIHTQFSTEPVCVSTEE